MKGGKKVSPGAWVPEEKDKKEGGTQKSNSVSHQRPMRESKEVSETSSTPGRGYEPSTQRSAEDSSRL